MVFFTTVVFGAVMPSVVKYFDKNTENTLEKIDFNSVNNVEKDEGETYEFQRYEKISSKG